MGKILNNSDLNQRIQNSQMKKPNPVVITSPLNGAVLTGSTINVQGTASGKKLEFVEVRLDPGSFQGPWLKAIGIENWQYTFLQLFQ